MPQSYDVFLSYRGEDTRKNFIDHLYTALVQAGIHTFVIDERVIGENVAAKVREAIEISKISIIVFSKNYGSSTWCLDELVKIMERKKTVGHRVLPVFYDVDPSQVRRQTGSFAEAFSRHEERFKWEMDRVERWRIALKEAADMLGMVLEGRLESQFVKNIVGVIRNKLNQQTVFNLITEPVYNLSLKQKFRQSITSWQKGAHLGSGAFGIVYEGFTDDGFLFAVKEASLLAQEDRGKKRIFQLEQEISLLSQFEHENIVQYFGTDKDDAKLYIFLELVPNGSLETLYKKYELRDSQVSLYTRQILSGLKYLHEQNVVHRDIKCANILVDVSGSVKLADFGLAKITTMNDIKSSNGSPFWMAPEVVDTRKGGYGVAADIWSLGCTVLEMFIRKPPYHGMEPQQAMFKIAMGELPQIPNSLSNDAKDFIDQCLQVDPNDRPTAPQLLEHPFVNRPL